MNSEIDQRVNRDFSQARLHAFVHAVSGMLLRQSRDLLSFEDVRSRLHIRGQHDRGIRTVPIAQIVGSEGRYGEFDRLFLPLGEQTRGRWERIDRAHYQDINLPPVELYKLGDVYFVRDGNHRVSVARQRGQIDIDAHVIEFKVDVPLTPDLTVEDLPRIEERSDFLRWTNLAALRPEAKIVVTHPTGYLDVIRHINGHRYFLSLERGVETPRDDAVASWYDTVYLPLVSAICWSGILQAFPGRTETDLYLWIMDHRHYLTEQSGQDPGAKEAVLSYGFQFGPPKAQRVLRGRNVSPEEHDFLRWSELDHSSRGTWLELSDAAGWATLRRHIEDHRYYLGQERGRAVSTEEAATSWFDHVYQPVVEALRDQGDIERFPGRTPTDLYLLVMNHLSSLREQGIQIDVRAAVDDYTAHFGHEKTWALMHTLHRARRLLLDALRAAAS